VLTETHVPARRTPRRADARLLKRVLLAFWAMYFSIVALSNAIDLLDAFGVLHWTFLNSTNYDFMRGIVKVYGVGPGLTKLMLLGAFATELAGAVLFWDVLVRGRRALRALAWSAAVWTAFTFMTEFFLAYTSESPFRELLMLTIATALAVELIPEQ
jgi:hypothetical protein